MTGLEGSKPVPTGVTRERFCRGSGKRQGLFTSKAWVRGSTAIEFAIVGLAFLMFIFGILEFGRLLWIRNSLQYAAEETGRYAMANPSATQTTLVTYLKGRISTLDPATISATAVSSTVSGVPYLTVTANCQFTFLTALVGSGTITLSGRSRVPLL